jgi:preprotein translocase subunit SecG
MDILHELFVQILTVIFMAGVIVLAVFLGHKFRDFKDQKKAAKAENKSADTYALPTSYQSSLI